MAEPQGQEQAPFQVTVNVQYVKDFSFESPNAPAIFAPSNVQPEIQMGVNVQARPVADNTYEALLMIKVEAKLEDKTAFIAELSYGGIFTLPALPEEQAKVFLFVEAPRLLFPFARSILAEAIRDGGFPQVLINPIDFYALYQQNAAQMQKPTEGNA